MTSPPVVGLDVRRDTLWPQTGIGRYARNLLRCIQAMSIEDLNVRPIDVAGSQRTGVIGVGRGTPAPLRAIEEQVTMQAATRRLDLLHLPWSEGPIRPHCPMVMTLHDLTTLENASLYRRRFRIYYNTLLRAQMRQAAAVIVSSQSTLKSALEYWPDQCYHVIPMAIDPCFQAATGNSRSIEPSVLYTGGYDPRKRIPDLIASVTSLQSENSPLKLVLTGKPPDWVVTLARRSLGEHVEFTGYVDDERLAKLYRAAWVVAYPTDLEGFGFPIVESFASGTPVVATRAGSVEEVAGGAAILVEPGDLDALSEGIRSVLDDEVKRNALRRAGLKRASKYRWETVASETLDVYRSVLRLQR